MIFCIEDFKREAERIGHKNSYKDLDEEIISNFFNKTFEEVISGRRLNQDSKRPYIKKRLAGRGGYRIYLLAYIEKKLIYLLFIHPKTGSEGSENITDEYKALLLKNLVNSLKSGNIYKVNATKDNKLEYIK